MSVALGAVTLEHLTAVDVLEHARVASYDVPSLAGDLHQVLGRSSVRLRIAGSFFGPDAESQLAALRAATREGSPLDLLAEAVGDGYVARVVVTALAVQQRAGALERYDYWLDVVEHVDLPARPTLAPALAIDTSLAEEAARHVDAVQHAMSQVAQLTALLGTVGFGDPTTKAPQLLTAYTDAGGGRTDPALAVRDVL